jgi:hypothetical protein
VATDPSNFFQDLVNKLVSPPDFFSSLGREQRVLFEEQKLSSQPSLRRTGVPKPETWYRDRLAQALNGQTEVKTEVGRIDILTAREIIEVKAAPNWKHALGQILVYGNYYPYHQKRIHLIGEFSKTDLSKAMRQCQRYGVTVTWEA